jgi:hypothetical protein
MSKLVFLLLAGSLTACAARPAATTTPSDSQRFVLAARRAQMIAWLHQYAVAGQYPLDGAGAPISVFRDAAGRRCPMAELIHLSGRDDLVDAVVRENNAVRLVDVQDGPLHDWMMASGLTVPEIAMVQGVMAPEDMQRLMAGDARRNLAIGVVRGKLATAEIALRNDSAHSLDVAAAALPAGKLAATPVRGHVLAPRSVNVATRSK